MKVTIIEQINDHKISYEFVGSKDDVVSAISELALENDWNLYQVKEFDSPPNDGERINLFSNEYYSCLDLSEIPEAWEEVWIAQDFNGDIWAYDTKPVISNKSRYWYVAENDNFICLEEYGMIAKDWKESLYCLR